MENSRIEEEVASTPPTRDGTRRMETLENRSGVRGKKRGNNREVLQLGGAKKPETSLRRKVKRKMNKQRGKAGFSPLRKEANIKALMDTPISVLFVDYTKGALLVKRVNEEEKRL